MSASFSKVNNTKKVSVMEADRPGIVPMSTTTASTTTSMAEGLTPLTPEQYSSFSASQLFANAPLSTDTFSTFTASPSMAPTTSEIPVLPPPPSYTAPKAASSSFSSIPSAPPAPPVYHAPKTRLRPYVKYGKNRHQPTAFTSLLSSTSFPTTSSSTSSSNIPVPPPLPPVYRSRSARVRPFVKYGKFSQPKAFTWVIKESSPTFDFATTTTTSIPVPPPLPPVYHYRTVRFRPYVKYGKNLQQPVAFTTLLETEVRPQALTREWKEWGAEKVFRMKQATFMAEQYLEEKGHQLKETAVHTGEYLGEKAQQAKETIAPTLETAKETAVVTGSYLGEKAHQAATIAASLTDWTIHKAAELENVAMETGKSLLEKAAHAVETLRVAEEEALEAAVIPPAPIPPVIYQYPISHRVRIPYVKYGKGMSNEAFTTVLHKSVPLCQEGTGFMYGKAPYHATRTGDFVPSLNPADYERPIDAATGKAPTLVTETKFTSTTTTTKHEMPSLNPADYEPLPTTRG